MKQITNGTENQNKYANDLKANILIAVDNLEEKIENARFIKKLKENAENNPEHMDMYNLVLKAIADARIKIDAYEDASETISKFKNYAGRNAIAAHSYIVNNVKDISSELNTLRVLL